MDLTLLDIYLIGCVLVLGIELFVGYIKYKMGEDIGLGDVIVGLFFPFLSWFCLIIMIISISDPYDGTPIIKGNNERNK